MATKIFIRHARKKYKNNKGPKGCYQHDPSIIENQEKQIHSVIENLVQKYGFPKVIYVSPFLRTQETLSYISEYLIQKYDYSFELITDRRIEEYLGFQKPNGEEADVSPWTALFSKPLLGIERIKGFEKRVTEFVNSLKTYNYNIWVITHGFFIDIIHKKYKGVFSNTNNLGGIVIDDKENIILF